MLELVPAWVHVPVRVLVQEQVLDPVRASPRDQRRDNSMIFWILDRAEEQADPVRCHLEGPVIWPALLQVARPVVRQPNS